MERRSPIPPPGQILGEGLMLEWRQNIEQRDKKRRGEALYPGPPPPGQILWKGLMLEWRQNIEQRDINPPWSNFRGGVDFGMETKS